MCSSQDSRACPEEAVECFNEVEVSADDDTGKHSYVGQGHLVTDLRHQLLYYHIVQRVTS